MWFDLFDNAYLLPKLVHHAYAQEDPLCVSAVQIKPIFSNVCGLVSAALLILLSTVPVPVFDTEAATSSELTDR